ncbi:hypothetical protein GW17_00040203 [Ensete ventricosum]|nr:hypothetical protein GW17_00040203 [Ensete ventricosum]
MTILVLIEVCNFDLYCPVRVVHTRPSGCRYTDHPLPGGSAKNRSSAVDFGHRRSIEGEIDRQQSIEGEKGKKKKRKRRKKKKTPRHPRRCAVVARGLPTPARRCRPWVVGDFSPARGERSRRRSAYRAQLGMVWYAGTERYA